MRTNQTSHSKDMITVMHTTKVDKLRMILFVRAYDSNFEMEMYRKEKVDMEYGEWWVKSQIIDTAMLIGIKYFFPEGELYIANPNCKYKPVQFKNKKP